MKSIMDRYKPKNKKGAFDAKWSMFNYRNLERNVERVTIPGLVSR
jgi:hypothetical protein